MTLRMIRAVPVFTAAIVLFPSVFLSRAFAVEGGDVVTNNVVLDKDLTTTWVWGLNAGADNITIDGNGHSLTFAGRLGSGAVNGIQLNNRTNVVIKNFSRISGFDNGIYVSGGMSNVIANCRIEENVCAGVTVMSSEALTVASNVVRGTHVAVDLSYNNSTSSKVIGNTFSGGRAAILGTVGTFAGNRMIHQAQSTLAGNRRLFRFGNVRRTGQPGEQFSFSFNTYQINDSPSSTSTWSVRTVPPVPVSSARSGSTVSGSFTPTRPGVHSLVVNVTDVAGNEETRIAQVLVGSTAQRSKTYYWTHYYPSHGQTRRMGYDTGSMRLSLPGVKSYRECGGWVQESPDALPCLPAVLINSVDFNIVLQFVEGANNPTLGIERDITFGEDMDRQVSVPASWSDGMPHWGSFSIENVNWTLDYPVEWYYVSSKFLANDPRVETGDPVQPSHNVVHYSTTTAPEVRSFAAGDYGLLLAATAESVAGGGEEIVVLGENAQTDVVLTNFCRPFLGAAAQIGANNEVMLNCGVVSGEQAYAAVPLDVHPSSNAVEVVVGEWSTATGGVRMWSEAAVADPGVIAHGVCGLATSANYRVAADGVELAVGSTDSQGKLLFDYAGPFPVTLVVSQVTQDAYGIPDSWKIQYFGSATATNAGAMCDADGDGMSNYAEWKAGTDPVDAGSRFQCSRLRSDASPGQAGLVIEWSSVTGKFYTIQRSTNLFEGFTIPAASNIAGVPGMNVWTANVIRAGGEYFRVKVE